MEQSETLALLICNQKVGGSTPLAGTNNQSVSTLRELNTEFCAAFVPLTINPSTT